MGQLAALPSAHGLSYCSITSTLGEGAIFTGFTHYVLAKTNDQRTVNCTKLSDEDLASCASKLAKPHIPFQFMKRGPSFFRLWSYAQSELPRLFLGFVALGINAITNLSYPRLLGESLDQSLSSELPSFLLKASSYFVLGAVASFARVLCVGTATDAIANRLRSSLFASLLKKKATYFFEAQTADMVLVMDKDVKEAAEAFTERLAAGLRSLNSAVFGSFLLMRISPELTAVSLGVIPVISIGAMTLSRLSRTLAERVRHISCHETMHALNVVSRCADWRAT